MDQTRSFKRWLAGFRVIAGATFVYQGVNHALGGWATAAGFTRGINAFASHDPLHWYTSFMVPIVLGSPSFFGPLFTYGMILTGLGMIFGFLLVPALLAALWLNANNFLMGFAGGGVHYGLNLLMIAVELALLQTGAWRAYSLDGLLFSKESRSSVGSADRALGKTERSLP